jgi:hypothetical protein
MSSDSSMARDALKLPKGEEDEEDEDEEDEAVLGVDGLAADRAPPALVGVGVCRDEVSLRGWGGRVI